MNERVPSERRPSERPRDPLELLRGAPIGVATPSEIEAERQRLVPWLEGAVADFPAVRKRQQRRQRLAWGASVLGLAAAVALGIGLWRAPEQPSGPSLAAAPSPGGLRLVAGSVESQSARISAGSHFALASRVHTPPQGSATFVSDSGYRVELGAETELGFDAAPERQSLRLTRGQVELSVPKLPAGHTLEVQTADATVRVRGTRFAVSLLGAGDERHTCVTVTEGRVEVERAGQLRFLDPGQSDGCQETVQASAPIRTAAASGPNRSASVETTLAEESRLLTVALAAERAGQAREASRAYAELLRRFPASRFSPEARAGLGRLGSGSQP